MTASREQTTWLPAEWNSQWGVQLTWPHEDTDWLPILNEVTECYLNMSQAIASRENLLVVTPHPARVRALLESRLSSEEMGRVSLCEMPTNDTWARDHAPITLTATDGQNLMLDFQFNGWGKKFGAEKDNAIGRNLHAANALHAPMENHLDFVLEGGAIESDGQGTIMTTSQCLLAPNRNQPLDRQDIELELKRRLRAQRVIWLDHGNLEGDDTDGHVDTIVRMAPDNTLLYMGCDDTNDSQYDDLKALEQQLKELRTTDGKPYRLLALPSPTPIYDDGERLPATYANFLVINGAVLMPTYRQPENDTKAKGIIAQAFPDRKIVAIDACTAIRQHGSIHCLTMQFPEGVL